MSKVALALGSFIVGAVLGSFALSGIYTSTRVQASQGERIGFAGSLGEPIVPPFRTHIAGGGILGGTVQSLDGVECNKCTLAVGRLTYAGGACKLNNARIPKEIPLELRGAALNTINLLVALGYLPTPNQNPAPQKSLIINATLQVTPQNSFTVVSLEGLQK